MEGRAHYLYYSSTATATKRYWFYTEPNINILINNAKSSIERREVQNEILERLQKNAGAVQYFNTLVNPKEEIPEQKRPALIILDTEHVWGTDGLREKTSRIIEKISTKKGNSERVYRNTFLFLICSEAGYGKLSTCIQDFLACRKIMDEYKSQLKPEIKADLKSKIDEHHSACVFYCSEILR